MDGAGHLGLLTWLGLDLLVALLGLETQAESDLHKRTRGTVALHIAQGQCNQWILFTQMWAQQITK